MSIENVAVSTVMVKDVKTANENNSLQEICRIMNINKIGSVIIIADFNKLHKKTPVGIITERDVVRHIATRGVDELNLQPMQSLMSHPLVTVSPNSSLRDALVILISKNIRRLPVVDSSENLVGIITDRDIYREIAKSETLIAGLLNDEFLRKYTQRLEQPWVYNLGEILHKRLSANAEPREKFSGQ